MKPSQVAAQLFTIREHLKTPADIAESFRKIREIGYEAVQISGMTRPETGELKKMLDDNGLKCCSTHDPANAILKETDKVIDFLKAIDCPTTAIPSLPAEYRSLDGYKRLAKEASEAGQKMKDAGITLMYHNHRFEFEKYDGKTGLDIIYDESDPELLQGEIDTYWVQAGGACPAAWCARLRNRLPVVHFKDMAIINNEQVICEIGVGNLDFHKVTEECEKSGTQWFAVEQDTCPGDPFESLKISFEYIKNNLCS